MNLKNLLMVARFEYYQTVKRPAFWATTLLMPIFFGIIMFISGYSSMQTEEYFSKISEEVKQVDVVDETGLILDAILQAPLSRSTDKEASIEKVKKGEIDALIYYPKSVLDDGKFEVYAKKNGGIFGEAGYGETGKSLIKASAIAQITDTKVQKAISMEFTNEVKLFDEKGEEAVSGIESLIVPAISLTIFFLAVFISASFLLQSVSEEKENRMIEFILSIVKEETLIYGKIVGLSSVVLTQLLVWIVGGLIILAIGGQYLNISIDLSLISITPMVLFTNLYFVLMGFLLFAAIMVGVGAVATSYKDSQGLSSIFIISSVFPLYFITYLLSQPNGAIAWIASIFPLTAPMVLLIRNSLGALSTPELIFGMVIVLIYVLVAFYLATRLFNLGALMYSRRPTLKEMLYALKK